jgi:hypothetical protein
LNLFQFPEPRQGRNFLRILQTINPTYSVETVKPFAGFPRYTEKNGFARHVNPAKRTIALAVFSASPNLVKELSTASGLLYETDRIEVGRRLDYSCWINFVELASSTRWSEISADIKALLNTTQQTVPDMAQPIANLLHHLQPSDRIKSNIKDELADWLLDLLPKVRQDSRELIQKALTDVQRVEYFEAARDIIRNRMPLFVVIGSFSTSAKNIGSGSIASFEQDPTSFQHLLQLIAERARAIGQKSANGERVFLRELNEQLSAVQPPTMDMWLDKSVTGELLLKNNKPNPKATDRFLFPLRQIEAKACLAVALSRIVYKTEAILLFDEPERGLPEVFQEELADFIVDISKTSQCLYAYSNVDIFPKDAVGRQYSAAELDMAVG